MDKFPNYREQIKTVFKTRQAKNSKYSLRAFARDLSLDPGQLSLVLNGKKNISLLKASELSKVLFGSSRDMLIFFHAVEHELAEGEDVKKLLEKKIQALADSHTSRITNISEDEFEVISQWYNIPLLELTGIKDHIVTPDFAADYFRISNLEALLGLEALHRLGFVSKKGKQFVRLKHVTTTTEIPSLAIKRFHSQMIKQAEKALFQQDLSKRYFSGTTFSVPAGKIDEIKKMIEEHEKRIRDYAMTLKNEPNQVIYQASSQLFSLCSKDFKGDL